MDDPQNDQNQTVPQVPKSLRDQMILAQFIDQLIQEKNDPSITPENMPAVKQALIEELNQQLNEHLLGLIDEKQQDELDKLLQDEAPDEEIDAFFERSIPNIDVEIGAVIINFRSAFLATFKKEPSESQSAPQEQQATPVVEEVADDLMPAPVAPAQETPAPEEKAWN